MNESMMIEAIRAVGAGGTQFNQTAMGVVGASSASAVSSVSDPAAVERFQAAMAAEAVQPAQAVPFASEVGAAWDSARAQNQELLHRIKTLSEMSLVNSTSMANLMELQYEVMNLSFQQDVVTKIADKSSTAIQTLIKNQ